MDTPTEHLPDTQPEPSGWRPVLTRKGRPLYLAIADAMASDLREGRLRPGERLPPQRQLADALGVDLTTVTRAYGEARARGLIEARVGQGTFVRGLAEPPRRSPDMSMNLPPVFDDPALAGRMWREIGAIEGDGGLPLLLGYLEAGGAREDRIAAVRWLSDRLPDVAPERTLIAGGAQAALMAIFNVLARRGDTVCTEALCYPGFRSLASQLGLKLVGVEIDKDGLIPEAFEAACRTHAPKALYCTPTLHNPTTATLPARRRAALVRIAREYGVPIVEDDAYGPLKPDAPPPLAALAPELGYYVSGLAKVMSPALRIAYIVAPSEREALRIAAVQRATIGMASPLSAMIATRWIQGGVAASILDAIRAETRARFASVRRHLPHDSYDGQPDAFHVWLRLPEGWSRGLFTARLQAQDVTVVPSDAFSVFTPPPEAVRLSLGAFRSRDGLDRALERIRDLLDHDAAWDLPTI